MIEPINKWLEKITEGFFACVLLLVGFPMCVAMSWASSNLWIRTGDWTMFALIGFNATIIGVTSLFLGIGVIYDIFTR